MSWTAVNLLIEIIAGIAGAHFAAAAANDYGFGSLGHSVVGAMGGGFVGHFLPVISAAIVTTNGLVNEPRLFEQIAAHSLAGATAGGILVLTVGFLKQSIDTHRAPKLKRDAAALSQAAATPHPSASIAATTVIQQELAIMPQHDRVKSEPPLSRAAIGGPDA
jgi:hypothetical protein